MWHELKHLLIILTTFLHIFIEVYCMIDVFWFISGSVEGRGSCCTVRDACRWKDGAAFSQVTFGACPVVVGARSPLAGCHVARRRFLSPPSRKIRFSISFPTFFSFFYLSIVNPNHNDFFNKVLDHTTTYVPIFFS